MTVEITPRPEDRRRAHWRAEALHIMQHFRNRRGHRNDAEGYCIDCTAMMIAAQERAYAEGKRDQANASTPPA